MKLPALASLLAAFAASAAIASPAHAAIITSPAAYTISVNAPGGSMNAVVSYTVDTTSGAVKMCYTLANASASSGCVAAATFSNPSSSMVLLSPYDAGGEIAIINLVNGKEMMCLIPATLGGLTAAPTSLSATCKAVG